MDTHAFYTHLLSTTRANLSYVQGSERTPDVVRQAASAALQEANSTLSQAAFFAAVDALGGQQAVLDCLKKALAAADHAALAQIREEAERLGAADQARRERLGLDD